MNGELQIFEADCIWNFIRASKWRHHSLIVKLSLLKNIIFQGSQYIRFFKSGYVFWQNCHDSKWIAGNLPAFDKFEAQILLYFLTSVLLRRKKKSKLGGDAVEDSAQTLITKIYTVEKSNIGRHLCTFCSKNL